MKIKLIRLRSVSDICVRHKMLTSLDNRSLWQLQNNRFSHYTGITVAHLSATSYLLVIAAILELRFSGERARLVKELSFLETVTKTVKPTSAFNYLSVTRVNIFKWIYTVKSVVSNLIEIKFFLTMSKSRHCSN